MLLSAKERKRRGAGAGRERSGGRRAMPGRTGGVRGCSPLAALPDDARGQRRGAVRNLRLGLEDHHGSWVTCTEAGTQVAWFAAGRVEGSTSKSRNNIPPPEHPLGAPFLRGQAGLLLHSLCTEAPFLGGHKALPSPQWHFQMTSVSVGPSCPGWPLVGRGVGSSSRCLGS